MPTEERFCPNEITLRDWFAGQALAGIVAKLDDARFLQDVHFERVAERCYLCADAMLKKRAEKQQLKGE